MAKGRKTGGRNFKKGQGGRKKGAKDRVPRGLKAKINGSIRAMYDALLKEEPALFERAIRRDLGSSRGSVAFQHVQLAGYYLDGKPVETVRMIDITKLSDDTLRRILEETGAHPAGS